jgi:hypothetical protein
METWGGESEGRESVDEEGEGPSEVFKVNGDGEGRRVAE